MTITQKTRITFRLPDEGDLAEKFQSDNDMDEWKQDICTVGVTFTQSKSYWIGRRED